MINQLNFASTYYTVPMAIVALCSGLLFILSVFIYFVEGDADRFTARVALGSLASVFLSIIWPVTLLALIYYVFVSLIRSAK